MKTLVADDDPVYRALLESLLKRWGFEVTLAEDGQQAMAFLSQPDPPRLLVLDWMMPNVDGYEVCANVRADQSAENAYILLLTGSRNRQDIDKAIVVGADDFLLKPFDPLELLIRMRAAKRILDLRERLQQSRQFDGFPEVPAMHL